MLISETAIPPVTRRSLTGVWLRRSIWWPDGRIDGATRVLWLQSDAHYADVRFPAARPEFAGVTRIEQCSPEQQAWLARQQGFAGTLLHDETGNWLWLREVDYQPPTAARDIGRLRYIDASCRFMMEEGVESAYTELWERVDGASGAGAPLVLQVDPHEADASRGYLVAVGDHFLLAVDPRPPLPAAPSMAALLSAGGTASSLLTMELSWGQRRGRMEDWIVARSTLPWREGQPALVARATFAKPIDDGPSRLPLWSPLVTM